MHTKHKRALLVWLAIYPLVTVLFYLLGDLLLAFPLPLRTLALTIVAVPLMSYLILPFYQKLFAKMAQQITTFLKETP